MYSAETERRPPLCALGAALAHRGPAPVGGMDGTVLEEGVNDRRRTFTKTIQLQKALI